MLKSTSIRTKGNGLRRFCLTPRYEFLEGKFLLSADLAFSAIEATLFELDEPLESRDSVMLISEAMNEINRLDALEDDFPQAFRNFDSSRLEIVLHFGPNLSENLPARAALERAAEFWESVLFDPVVINIDVELTDENFSDAGVLGAASSETAGFIYSDVRSLLISDASPEESIVQRLPSTEQLVFDLPEGIGLQGNTENTSIRVTRANAQALGFIDLPGRESEHSPDVTIDGAIRLNSAAEFDFDRSDGVEPGSIDLESVGLHEIGHVLGFSSEVDLVDALVEMDETGSVTPELMDLFRLAPGEGGNFSTAPRILNTGDNFPIQVFHDGEFDVSEIQNRIDELEQGDIPLSTGKDNGDGRQASHLKDDPFLGVRLGVMDPTIQAGTIGRVSEVDLRILGLLGWDVFQVPAEVEFNRIVTENASPQITGTISQSDSDVFIRLPGSLGHDSARLTVEGDSFDSDAFTLTNDQLSQANIVRAEIVLPGVGAGVRLFSTTPFFSTEEGGFFRFSQDFQAVAEDAQTVGLISPESDEENDGDVPNSSKVLSLTFDNFEPGESISWRIDMNMGTITGDEISGAQVTVDFDNGRRITGLLAASARNEFASSVLLEAEHLLPAVNFDDGSWQIPEGSYSELSPGEYDVEVITAGASGVISREMFAGGLRIVEPGTDITAPEVNDILIRGTSWMTDQVSIFNNDAESNGPIFPWSSVDQIMVVFGEDVLVEQQSLRLRGTQISDYVAQVGFVPESFQYDPESFTAIWTLQEPIQRDKLQVQLSPEVQDLAGNILSEGVSSKTDARFNILPGDINSDGLVDLRDLQSLRRVFMTNRNAAKYSPFADFDADGIIDLRDLQTVRESLLTVLPSDEPAQRVDAVFATLEGESMIDHLDTVLLESIVRRRR